MTPHLEGRVILSRRAFIPIFLELRPYLQPLAFASTALERVWHQKRTDFSPIASMFLSNRTYWLHLLPFKKTPLWSDRTYLHCPFLVPYTLQGSACAGEMVFVKPKFHQDSPPPRNVSLTDKNTRPVDEQC